MTRPLRMTAIAFRLGSTVDAPDCLTDIVTECPLHGPHDLRVAVHAVSVNPLDTNRYRRTAKAEGGRWKAAIRPRPWCRAQPPRYRATNNPRRNSSSAAIACANRALPSSSSAIQNAASARLP